MRLIHGKQKVSATQGYMLCLTIHAETPPNTNTTDIHLFCKPEHDNVCEVTLFLLCVLIPGTAVWVYYVHTVQCSVVVGRLFRAVKAQLETAVYIYHESR